MSNDISRNTDGLGGKNLSKNRSELSSLLSLDKVDERFVDVAQELNETGVSGVFEIFKDSVNTVNGINSRVKLFIQDGEVAVVFNSSLNFEVVKVSVDIVNITVGLSDISLRVSESVFTVVKSDLRVCISNIGIVNFRVTETDFISAINLLGVPEGSVSSLFVANGIGHALDFSDEGVSGVIISIDILGTGDEAQSQNQE